MDTVSSPENPFKNENLQSKRSTNNSMLLHAKQTIWRIKMLLEVDQSLIHAAADTVPFLVVFAAGHLTEVIVAELVKSVDSCLHKRYKLYQLDYI